MMRHDTIINIKELSAKIKEKRLAEKISLRDAAIDSGVSFSTIARIERMEGMPDIATIIKLCEWIGKETSHLLQDYPVSAHIHHYNKLDEITANALKQLITVVTKNLTNINELGINNL